MVWLRPLSRDTPLWPSDEYEVTSGLRLFGRGALRQPENFDQIFLWFLKSTNHERNLILCSLLSSVPLKYSAFVNTAFCTEMQKLICLYVYLQTCECGFI